MKKNPLQKISVKDITEYCSISRNAFYYHFKDKYDLINWIFYNDVLKNINTFQQPEKLADSFVQLCKALHKERAFYLDCFQYKEQNSLYEVLHECYYELWKMNLDMYSREYSILLCEERLNAMASLNTYSLIGIIYDWVKNGMNSDYLSYFEQIKNIWNMDFFPMYTPYAPETLETLLAKQA